jgi:hypothetical protein
MSTTVKKRIRSIIIPDVLEQLEIWKIEGEHSRSQFPSMNEEDQYEGTTIRSRSVKS